MARATRFSVAVHALALIDHFDGRRLTSESVADSVGTNASFVRRLLAMLARAEIVESSAGIAGARLARPAGKITLLDIYRAVDMEDKHRLEIHGNPNPRWAVRAHLEDPLHPPMPPAAQASRGPL